MPWHAPIASSAHSSFPAGAANLAVLSTFGAADVTIFSDSLNHASIIDSCRLAKAKTVVYRYTDVAHLKS